MKLLKTGKYSSCSFLFTLVLFTGSLAGEFQATPGSSTEAIATGKVREFLGAMEAKASEAEKNASSSWFPQRYWAEASSSYGEASWAARSSGQLQRSLSYAQRALETAEKARDPLLQTRAIYRLTSVHAALRQSAKAKEWAEQGLKVAKQLSPGPGREGFEGEFYRLLGSEFLRIGDLQKAIEYLSYSLQIQEKRLSFFETRRYGQSSPEAIPLAQHLLLFSLNYLASAYRLAGRLEDAIAAYEKGIALIKRSGVKTNGEGDLYQGLGQVYLAQKDYSRALENLTKALQMAEERRWASVIYTASSQIGDLYRQNQKPSEAVGYYRKAIENVESTRSLLSSEENRQSFFEGGLDAYVGMIGVLSESGKAEEAFNYSERARSRAFLDLVGSKAQLSRVRSGLLEEEKALQERTASIKARLAGEQTGAGTETETLRKEQEEAERAYNTFLSKVRKQDKEQASLMNVEPLAIRDVQNLVDPGQSLVEYFVTESVTYVWVVEKDKLRFVRVDLPREKLAGWVKALREHIFSLGEKEKFNEVSASLYKQLIQPLLSHISGKELIIVPHDVLHYLPFHALLSPEGKYLIESYPIYYLSSASLLQFTKEKRRAKGEKVLALGNPDLGDAKMNLQFAELEAKNIQGLYPKSTVLLKREATEDKAKGLSPQNDIIHFASHAELNENDPLASAILLAKSDKEDGRLEVREIFSMDLKANLVVLSACETGLGKLSSGDELVGLTRAFIYAGTPSVVASLWNVEDSSTAQLMASFYKNLRTMSKVEALRQAQLELINGRTNSDLLMRRGIGGVGKLGETPEGKSQVSDAVTLSTSHPYFWAPFILVGDGK